MGAMTLDLETSLRSFAGNAYWESNSTRSNLDLLTGAFVHRLVATEDEGELVITGVEFSHKSDGGTCIVKVLREVILSAGCVLAILLTFPTMKTGLIGISTLFAPNILELSGIGHPDVLRKAGIPVKLALNGVGEDIQEHIHVRVIFGMSYILQQGHDLTRDQELPDSIPDESIGDLYNPEVAEKHKELMCAQFFRSFVLSPF